MPTTTIDSTALPSVRSAGRRPAWNQIAAMMSMPLPLFSRTSRSWPNPVTSPAPSSTATCHQAAVRDAASSRSNPAPGHSVCCTNPSNSVSTTAPSPVPTPVSATASQNRAEKLCANGPAIADT